MDVYNGDDFEVKSKSDESPVTIADETADKHIFAGLRLAFPDIAIVTEEQSDTHSETSNTFFIVDPLDGTKEFIHRRGDFTVNIAYVVDGKPVAGVVYAPAKQRLFYTDATGQSVEEFGDHNAVSNPDNDNLIVVASKSHRDQATEDYINKYALKDSAAAGSSLKFCLVATGEADLYPRVGRTMEWGMGYCRLAMLCCFGAGGDVVRFDNPSSHSTYGTNPFFENTFFIRICARCCAAIG
ncbi:UNVERIFIED_CONTAM: hypothetical protein GTU68_004835 [Idotea baltica]|nr:hypothetical protein [Idotea baltica]